MNSIDPNLVSVIVPVYNVGPWLRECVESLLGQTWRHLELLLIDDGSTDDSPSICREYAAGDSRVRYYRIGHGGLSGARNFGLEQARGGFLSFVDGDDFAAPDFLSDMLHHMRQSGAEACVCNFRRVGPDVSATEQGLSLQSGEGTGLTILRAAGKKDGFRYVSVCNKLYRRELWEGVRFPPGRLHEDEFVFHHIFLHCGKVCIVNRPLYFYRKRPGSLTEQAVFSAARLDILDALNKRILAYERKGLDFLLPGAYKTYAAAFARCAWRLDRSRPENRACWKVFKRRFYAHLRRAARCGSPAAAARFYLAALAPALFHRLRAALAGEKP